MPGTQPNTTAPLPTLSVVVPAYNAGRYLERCLCAVLSQNVQPVEVIVYDDVSTDDSYERAQELVRRWPEVRLLRGEANSGVIGVCNRMLDQVRGQWVHFLAADDVPLPGFYHLALQQAARHPQAGVLFGAFVTADEHTGARFTETAERWIEPGYHTPRQLLWRLFHKAPALFSLGYTNIWRTAALREFGGFLPELGPYSDTLVFRCLCLRHGGIYIDHSPVVNVRVSLETYGGQVWKDVHAYEKTLKLCASIMRERYPELFPERYVANWEAKIPHEIGLSPWPKWRRAKHAASWGLRKLWIHGTRLLGR